jgi:hypothetical protein
MRPRTVYCGIVKLRRPRKELHFGQDIIRGSPREQMGDMLCAKGSSGGRPVVAARRHGFCNDT